MKISYFIFLFFICVQLSAQTGPAGVGTNVTSAQQNRVWYKADAAVFNDAGSTLAVSGNSVQQWNDQSGVANNAVQATTGNRPTYLTNVVNGFPALRFNGATWITASAFPGIANNVGYTYLVVVRDTSFTAGALGDGAGDYVIDRGPPGAEVNELAGLKISNTNKFGFQKRDGGGGGLGGPVSVTSVNTASFQVINYRQTPGTTKVYDIFVDGTLEASVSSADGDYVPPVPQIGHHYQAGSSGMKGYISEFLLYNYNVNEAQMNILNNYLSAKYGLTLSSNDQYLGDTPANGNYDFEVAGVGQHSTGANLSAASSISGGLEVTQATTMDNNEYLLYGHQTGTNSINLSDIGGMSPGPLVARWNRIWYLDWTHVGGTSETVNLTFDMSDGGMSVTPAAPLSNYKLLYRAGLSGNWTELANASAISGDRISFNGIAYTIGDGYYTIGTLNNTISPLPIHLLSFKASCCNKNVCLVWATATESNNDYFTIEKSIDGINFEMVETIKGAGNSAVVLNYSSEDHLPYKGISYYRLKQTDYNGGHSYSSIQVVNEEEKEFYFNIYPRPNNGIFEIEINSPASIIISDSNGNKVLTEFLKEGKHAMTIQNQPDGIYFLKLTSGTNERIVKFVKE